MDFPIKKWRFSSQLCSPGGIHHQPVPPTFSSQLCWFTTDPFSTPPTPWPLSPRHQEPCGKKPFIWWIGSVALRRVAAGCRRRSVSVSWSTRLRRRQFLVTATDVAVEYGGVVFFYWLLLVIYSHLIVVYVFLLFYIMFSLPSLLLLFSQHWYWHRLPMITLLEEALLFGITRNWWSAPR